MTDQPAPDTAGEDHPRTGIVPWDTVTDEKGRPAWTIGQLRAAIAHLPDDAPFTVTVATHEDGICDTQIVTDAGSGWIDWGDGYGRERDPLLSLYAYWPSRDDLLTRPDRPRRDQLRHG